MFILILGFPFESAIEYKTIIIVSWKRYPLTPLKHPESRELISSEK